MTESLKEGAHVALSGFPGIAVRSGSVAVPCHVKDKCRCDVRWGQDGRLLAFYCDSDKLWSLLAAVRAAVRCVWEEQHWLELYCDSDSDSDSDGAERRCGMFVGVLYVQLQYCAAYKH